MRCVRVVVRGRVQGVWFRGWVVQEARARDLDGWVRNRADGTLEALFQGAGPAVASMVEACRKGPPAARVVELEEFPGEETSGSGFQQLPSV